ncbi:hypothetical protein TNIN_495191 [Trichonephila inaurata madagascariensis]|uniref:Uncharacterized protein n=1 Tax=Trichonephila inaurata madagascariensis TaxID=2747483 RepID=A0A8X6X9W8_9ARAC|nr:hypothetical protein TNIN_495191 [Trichonephila inaurata madagascariensis]
MPLHTHNITIVLLRELAQVKRTLLSRVIKTRPRVFPPRIPLSFTLRGMKNNLVVASETGESLFPASRAEIGFEKQGERANDGEGLTSPGRLANKPNRR